GTSGASAGATTASASTTLSSNTLATRGAAGSTVTPCAPTEATPAAFSSRVRTSPSFTSAMCAGTTTVSPAAAGDPGSSLGGSTPRAPTPPRLSHHPLVPQPHRLLVPPAQDAHGGVDQRERGVRPPEGCLAPCLDRARLLVARLAREHGPHVVAVPLGVLAAL